MTTTITGPRHPLSRLIRDEDQFTHRAALAYMPAATAALAHHRQSGNTETVYRVDGPGPDDWTAMGTAEEDANRVLLGHGREYVTISGHDTPYAIARAVAPNAAPSAAYTRAIQLRDAAHRATPMVGAVLAVCLRAGAITWDTDEAVDAAGSRIALDAAWRLHATPNPAGPHASHIATAVLDGLNVIGGAADYARAYLADRVEIDAHLAAAGIAWGGDLLDASAAADRAAVAPSTWRAHVSRDEAPGPDLATPPRWRPATIDAWRLTQPRASLAGW